MITLQISDIKNFMSKLLISDIFDSFFACEVTLTTFNTFIIDGHLNKDFYTKEELADNYLEDSRFSRWADLKPFCFSIIKGKNPPLQFKIVLAAEPNTIAGLITDETLPFQPGDVNGLYLTIKYNDSKIHCTTGQSLKLFTLDKSLEHAWDNKLKYFFQSQDIDFDLV